MGSGAFFTVCDEESDVQAPEAPPRHRKALKVPVIAFHPGAATATLALERRVLRARQGRNLHSRERLGERLLCSWMEIHQISQITIC